MSEIIFNKKIFIKYKKDYDSNYILHEDIKIFEDKIEINNKINEFDLEEYKTIFSTESIIYESNQNNSYNNDDIEGAIEENKNIIIKIQFFFEDSFFINFKSNNEYYIFKLLFKNDEKLDIDSKDESSENIENKDEGSKWKIYFSTSEDKDIFQNLLNKLNVKNKSKLKSKDNSFLENSPDLNKIIFKEDLNSIPYPTITDNNLNKYNHENSKPNFNLNNKNLLDILKNIDDYYKNKNELIFKWPKLTSCVVYYDKDREFDSLKHNSYFSLANYDTNYLQTEEGEDIEEYLSIENSFYLKQGLTNSQIDEVKSGFNTFIKNFIKKFYSIDFFVNLKKIIISNRYLNTDKSEDISLLEEFIYKFLELNYDFNLFFDWLVDVQNIFIFSYNKIWELYYNYNIDNLTEETDIIILKLINYKILELNNYYFQFLNITIYENINEEREIVEKFIKNYLNKFVKDTSKVNPYCMNSILQENFKDIKDIIDNLENLEN